MNSLEIISLIFAVLVILKILLLWINPKWMTTIINKFSKWRNGMVGVILIFTAIVGYFVFANLTVVQVVPGILLGTFLMGMVFLIFPKNYVRMAKEVLKERKKLWVPFLLWIILAVWTLYHLFMV